MITKFIILSGLPGSGKTTFGKALVAKSKANYVCNSYGVRTNMTYIDADKYFVKSASEKPYKDVANEVRGAYDLLLNEVVIDAMFVTNDSLKCLIKAICDAFIPSVVSKYEHFEFNFEIHRWKPNISRCIENDANRVLSGSRKERSLNTIKNTKVEPIDIKYIDPNLSFPQECKIEVIYHDVIVTPPHERFFVEKAELYGSELSSNEWCTGGTYESYDGSRGLIGAEKPEHFDELDELLEKIAPSLTYIQYRALEKECVTVKSRSENDYYGGTTTYMWWSCDLKKLYDFLTNNVYQK